MSNSSSGGRPPGLTRRPSAARVTSLYLGTVRAAIYDLQIGHGLTDTEMVRILTQVASDLAAQLPEDKTHDPPLPAARP